MLPSVAAPDSPKSLPAYHTSPQDRSRNLKDTSENQQVQKSEPWQGIYLFCCNEFAEPIPKLPSLHLSLIYYSSPTPVLNFTSFGSANSNNIEIKVRGLPAAMDDEGGLVGRVSGLRF